MRLWMLWQRAGKSAGVPALTSAIVLSVIPEMMIKE